MVSPEEESSPSMKPEETMALDYAGTICIDWPCDSVVPSKRCEQAMRRVLHRKGEWGRGRDLGEERLEEITQACEKQGMTLYQALSLRRGLLRSFNPGRFARSSAMGTSAGQRDVATLFEEAVVSFLKLATASETSSAFLTESALLKEMKAGKRPRGPTPDILFLKPVKINGRDVRWIDAKQFYASAMLAGKQNTPNGKLQKTAMRYNEHFGGQGAFVFARGFCADLSSVVPGALLLDATPLDISSIEAYQDAPTGGCRLPNSTLKEA